MIAVTRFGAARDRVRALRFVPRASLPISTACAVARDVESVLSELLGACEITVGEPVAVTRAAWSELTREALAFVRRGRPADAVLVVPRADARRLVLHAFGEAAAPCAGGAPFSDLERRALERILARCAEAFASVCEGSFPGRAATPADVPYCAAYVDLRVRAPVALTVGVGLTRGLPDPAPSRTVDAGLLADVRLEARAVFAEGILDAAEFVHLRPGDIVKLRTKVGAPASLKVGGTRLAGGAAGAVASRSAFLVHDVAAGDHG